MANSATTISKDKGHLSEGIPSLLRCSVFYSTYRRHLTGVEDRIEFTQYRFAGQLILRGDGHCDGVEPLNHSMNFSLG